MNVLVAGGAGYIGSHTIIEILTNTDWTPISIDNFYNSSAETFDRIKDITGHDVKNYNLDLKDYDAVKSVFAEHNFVGIIHFAAFKSVPESMAKPLEYYDNNVNTLINILKLQKEFGVPNFIFSSSCSVYGSSKDLPVTEQTSFGKTECPYAYTKVVGENIIKDMADANHDLSFIALRYFNPVGAHTSGKIGELPNGVPNNLVPYITQTAYGIREQLSVFGDDYDTVDGSCVRDYIHVSDIADAHLKALKYLMKNSATINYDVFNLGSGNGVSVFQVIKAFESSTGVKLNYQVAPRRSGDIEKIYANSEKAEKILGWKADIDIDEMMKSAWKWQNVIGA